MQSGAAHPAGARSDTKTLSQKIAKHAPFATTHHQAAIYVMWDCECRPQDVRMDEIMDGSEGMDALEEANKHEAPRLIQLSEDELQLVFSHLHDVLLPNNAVALYATCKLLWARRHETVGTLRTLHQLVCSLACRCTDWEERLKRSPVSRIEWVSIGLIVSDCKTVSYMCVSDHLMWSLQTLNLRDNSIGESGLRSLLPGLRKLQNLTSLNLEQNRLGNGGLIAFADGMFPKPSALMLRELFLGQNDETDDAAYHQMHIWRTRSSAGRTPSVLRGPCRFSPPALFKPPPSCCCGWPGCASPRTVAHAAAEANPWRYQSIISTT